MLRLCASCSGCVRRAPAVCVVLTTVTCFRDEDPLGRDFTYVDDIIDGVMAALDYEPTECGERCLALPGTRGAVPRGRHPSPGQGNSRSALVTVQTTLAKHGICFKRVMISRATKRKLGLITQT